jgi:hypothetical protein
MPMPTTLPSTCPDYDDDAAFYVPGLRRRRCPRRLFPERTTTDHLRAPETTDHLRAPETTDHLRAPETTTPTTIYVN